MTQRNALIIGASGSIGRAIAAAISNKGFGVALVGRDTAKLDQTRAQLNPAMRDALIIPCDVTDREQVKAMVDKVLGRMTAIEKHETSQTNRDIAGGPACPFRTRHPAGRAASSWGG